MLLKLRCICLVFLGFFATSAAFAGCSNSIVGGGVGAELYVEISDGGCKHEHLMINGAYKFDEECRNVGNGFACRPNGKTPISGATYELQNRVVGRYRCVKGCKKTTPKYLYTEPYGE